MLSGSYVIDGLEAGKYSLTVNAQGYAQARTEPFEVRSFVWLRADSEKVGIERDRDRVVAGVQRIVHLSDQRAIVLDAQRSAIELFDDRHALKPRFKVRPGDSESPHRRLHQSFVRSGKSVFHCMLLTARSAS